MDWGYLLATLVGGVIGVSGSVGVARMQRTTAREDRQADILRRSAAELLTAARDLWHAEQALHGAVFTLMNLHARHDVGAAERQAAAEDRLTAFAARREALTAADRSLNELWLVSPDLRNAGQALIDACNIRKPGEPLPSQEEREGYEAARAALVDAVRAAIVP